MFTKLAVVVTGGSSGIGLATAERFASLGAIVYNLDVSAPSKGSNSKFIECDVREAGQVRVAIKQVINEQKRIDVLFANAGVFALGDIEETEDQDLNRIIDTNIKGAWYVIQACIPIMKKQGKGAIVINGSDQSLVGRKKSAAYGLTKGALGQLTKSLALDYAKSGIRVNCVCPAAIDTPLCRAAIAEWARRYGGGVPQLLEQEHAQQPLGRMGQPEDVAKLVTFLSSDEAQNITGALISTDGGYVAQ